MSHGTHGFATVPVKFPDRKFMLVVSITVQLLAEFERCWINKQYSQFYRKLEAFWISCKRVCGWHIRKSDSSDQTGVSFSQPPVFYHFSELHSQALPMQKPLASNPGFPFRISWDKIRKERCGFEATIPYRKVSKAYSGRHQIFFHLLYHVF